MTKELSEKSEMLLKKHICLTMEDEVEKNMTLERFEEWKTYDFAKAVLGAIAEALSNNEI